jgi:16S rRNA (adenine1518-N6/adenine1519-N6)-dimethyltransferase
VNLDPLRLPSLLRDFGITPRKDLGQNFLVDDIYLRRIVQAAGFIGQEDALEIGAGAGNLTRYLAQAARAVVAVEIDQALFPLLKKTTSSFNNVRLVAGDILDQDIAALMRQPGYVVAANIPYYITSALIRFLLESPSKPSRIVLTIQHEVAQRVCALPGDLSLLALSVQLYGDPIIVLRIPAGAFYPPPNVDSAVLLVDLFPEPRIPRDQIDDFFRLAKAAFSQKRKMLRNTLAFVPGLDKDSAFSMLEQAQIDAKRRAQSLTLEEWRALVSVYQIMLKG